MKETFEFEMTFECENCGEKHEISEWRCTDFEYNTEEFECVCGAKIEVDWSVRFDIEVKCEPPKSEEDEECEAAQPAPNQIDMFTGLTLEQAKRKA